MNQLIFSFAVLFFVSGITTTAYASLPIPNQTPLRSINPEMETQIAILDITNAVIPSGFDSSTDAFVIVSGIFPNGCYRWNDAIIEHQDNFNHNITSRAQVSQGMCIMALVPFTREIKLGKFHTGNHTLRFLAGDGTYFEKMMNVE